AQCQDQVFTQRTGEISSPDYPAPYPPLSTCSYSIQVEDGLLITLEFVETFNVETHPEVLCPYDVLQIKTPKKQFGPFCGKTLPAKIETQSNVVNIAFITDVSGAHSGWKMKYTAAGLPCPGPEAPPHGHIAPVQAQYTQGDRYALSCDTGFALLENENVVMSFVAECRKNASWNKPMAKCIIVDCGQPEDIDNGTFTYLTGPEQTTYSAEIQYQCAAPYYTLKANSSGRYVCSDDGYWKNSQGEATLPVCEPVCGMREDGAVERIFGGRRAKPGEFPWQVMLISEHGELGGGSLLYDNWVLTAAHVVAEQRNPSALRVKLGILNKRAVQYEEAWAEEIFIHEGYKNDLVNFDNDIALIKLGHKVPINTTIAPICLPGKEERFQMKANAPVTVSGWGRTETRSSSVALLYTELIVISQKECTDAYANKSLNGSPLLVTENMLCAGAEEGGRDACQGDSGGPLVFRDAQTRKWFVAGIVSWALDCAVAGQYGVYTRVTSYIPWIESTITSNS
ncbi:MASP2 protease, partial [Alectura lathami]|nr:MASP2 protease [Alectura lathami]